MPNKRPIENKSKIKSKKGKLVHSAKRANKLNSKTPVQKEFDSFRHEIYKLGLTGLDKKERVDARYELAIKLGAKEKKWIKPNRGLGQESAELNRKELEEEQERDRKSTRLNSSHSGESRMPSSA